MKRFIAGALAFIFLLWILPLGIFIAPSKEKMFCGGQRAICLCSHMKAKKQPDGFQIAVKAVSPSTEKEPSGFSSNAYDNFSLSSFEHPSRLTPAFVASHPYQLLVLTRIDHVPKA